MTYRTLTGQSVLEHILPSISISPEPEGCWEWKGPSIDGYPRVKRDGISHLVTRLIYDIERGPLSDADKVLHRCDNPPCVRPSHLFVGTQADNIADMISKGRDVVLRGERSGMAKLTDDAVRTIRKRHSLGARQVDLAKEFGVTQATISRITRGAGWTHVS